MERLDEAIATGDRSAAVEIIMTEAFLIPAEYIEPMKNDPMWEDMEKLARTIAYDGRVVREVMAGKPWPENKWASVAAPTLVASGEMSEPFFHAAAKTLAEAEHPRRTGPRRIPESPRARTRRVPLRLKRAVASQLRRGGDGGVVFVFSDSSISSIPLLLP